MEVPHRRACVALELGQFALAPALSGEFRKMPLDELLSSALSVPLDESSAPAEAIDGLGDVARWKSPLRRTRLATSRVVSAVLVPIVNAVFFADVFVTFFTGELTPAGTLVPKPFVARYIVPGIGLQLIVNPTMIVISRWVKRIAVTALRTGPSLCFHLVHLSVPFVIYFYDCLLDLLLDFVEGQNKKTI